MAMRPRRLCVGAGVELDTDAVQRLHRALAVCAFDLPAQLRLVRDAIARLHDVQRNGIGSLQIA
ncbi:MAG: hypothetical protein IT530_18275 [Burkholderiales bacterium]|nr:hypothetical protein [Burkholderiales bacterium]